jgi:hypothetical protein
MPKLTAPSSGRAGSSAIRVLHWDELALSAVPELAAHSDGRVLVLVPAPIDHDECFASAGFTDFADTDDDWYAEFSALVWRLFQFLEQAGPARLPLGRSTLATPVEAIVAAARDDNFPASVVHFGSPTQASVSASAGHPLLWLWSARDRFDDHELLSSTAGSLELVRTRLDWSALT